MSISLVCYQLASNFIFQSIYKTIIGGIVLDRLLPSCFLVGCASIVCWTLGIRWWINSISCFPMSLAVLVLRVPEITFQNEGVLPVVAQDLEPFWRLFCRLPLYELDWTALYAPNFWGTKHMIFFLEKIRVVLKFNSNFSARHLSMAILSYGAFRLRNFRYCSWWCKISGCWTLFL